MLKILSNIFLNLDRKIPKKIYFCIAFGSEVRKGVRSKGNKVQILDSPAAVSSFNVLKTFATVSI